MAKALKTMKKSLSIFILLLLTLSLTGCDLEESSDDSTEENNSEEAQETKTYYQVTNVVDGDTIDVDIDGKTERIRLIGIDTPETVDPRKDVECFGKEASNKAKEILDNKKVYLESDDSQSDRDKYDRLLRYVFLEDGTHFNKMMIEEGYAQEYTYDNPYRYQEEFKKAQEEAKNAKKGLWADNVCNKPEEKETQEESSSSTSTTTPVPTPQPTPKPATPTYTCDCSKTCAQMSSCAEAQYQLNTCGCTRRDADKDGIACDSDCQ